MDNARTPKIFLYGRVHKGASKQGKYFSYLNSVKSLLREYKIDPSTLEEQAKSQNAWRSVVYNKTKKGHEDCINDMKEWRKLRKARERLARVPA